MSVRILEAPTTSWKSTLDGRVALADTTITVTSSTGLVASGVIVIDRQDGQGNNTPEKMEYCSFTGITTNTLTGVTRALAGSTAIDHNSGALVECFINVTHWGDFLDFLQVEHGGDGTHSVLSHANTIQVTGISGASGIKGDVVFIPGSNISIYAISGVSGHSYIKLDFSPYFPVLSLATTYISIASTVVPPLIVSKTMSIKSISAVLRSPTSGSSIILDINKNFTSLFTDQNTRLAISGIGTYTSTASIGTKTLTKGDILTLDIDST